MKTIKIGEEEYSLCENAEDLSIKRFVHLKEYMMYKQTGVNAPDLMKTLQRFIDGYDNESKSEMLITIYDYLTGTKQVAELLDADQMVFGIIAFEKGEDVNLFSESTCKEKLARMNDNGLTQGLVEESVENFIKTSSTHFVSSLKTSLMGVEEK